MSADGPRRLNHVVLNGLVATEPVHHAVGTSNTVMRLDLAFVPPGHDDPTGRCEVEVPKEVADNFRGPLRTGAPILIAGELDGCGGILAAIVESGPPAEDQALELFNGAG